MSVFKRGMVVLSFCFAAALVGCGGGGGGGGGGAVTPAPTSGSLNSSLTPAAKNSVAAMMPTILGIAAGANQRASIKSPQVNKAIQKIKPRILTQQGSSDVKVAVGTYEFAPTPGYIDEEGDTWLSGKGYTYLLDISGNLTDDLTKVEVVVVEAQNLSWIGKDKITILVTGKLGVRGNVDESALAMAFENFGVSATDGVNTFGLKFTSGVVGITSASSLPVAGSTVNCSLILNQFVCNMGLSFDGSAIATCIASDGQDSATFKVDLINGVSVQVASIR